LHIEYYDNWLFSRKLVISWGEQLEVDEATLKGSRANLAVCIEVDLGKPLISKLRLGRRRIRRVENEGIRSVCFSCGLYGHKVDGSVKKWKHIYFLLALISSNIWPDIPVLS
jgi:hypothetical protein